MSIKFSAVKLQATGKVGIFKPDENGYYTLVLGGLNVLNSMGELYTLRGAEELFQDSSTFMRRIRNGCLKSEEGHPKRLPGMSDQQFIQRIFSIDEANISAHISDVWLDRDYGRNMPGSNNRDMVAIMGKVKPAGPLAASLEASLSNPKENVCFSIRAITEDTFINGVNHRVLRNIVTWDHVNEPGISIANKWDSPGLESICDEPLTRTMLETMIRDTSKLPAMESTRGFAVETLRLFDKSLSAAQKPAYSKW